MDTLYLYVNSVVRSICPRKIKSSCCVISLRQFKNFRKTLPSELSFGTNDCPLNKFRIKIFRPKATVCSQKQWFRSYLGNGLKLIDAGLRFYLPRATCGEYSWRLVGGRDVPNLEILPSGKVKNMGKILGHSQFVPVVPIKWKMYYSSTAIKDPICCFSRPGDVRNTNNKYTNKGSTFGAVCT